MGAAGSVWEALAMPADLAFELIAARRRRRRRESNGAAGGSPAGGPASDDGRIRTNPDGSVSMRIGSMDTLRSFLGSKL